jgi:hypothetical protein
MKYIHLLAIAAAASVASTGFSQTPITINNNSFDSPSQVTGQGQHPSGWVTETGGIVSTYGGGFAGGDGANRVEAFSWGVTGTGATDIYQVLGTSFVAGYTYTLTALAAFNSGQPMLANSYFFLTSPTAQFSSTGTADATVSVSSATTTLSTFTISNYTATAADNGQAIEVGFYSPAQSNTAQLTAEIDDFNLTVTAPVPEPSSIAIVALGGLSLLAIVRWRRALS